MSDQIYTDSEVTQLLDEARFNGMAKVKVYCPHCSEKLVIAMTGWKSDAFSLDRVCKYCGRDYQVTVIVNTRKKEG